MRGVALLAATAMAVLCLGLLRPAAPAAAESILSDPGFEAFDDGSWVVDAALVEAVENPGSGFALRVTLGTTNGKVFQSVADAQPGAGYSASIEAWGDAGVTAELTLDFLDDGGTNFGAVVQGGATTLGGPPHAHRANRDSPTGTAGLRLDDRAYRPAGSRHPR